MAGFTRNEILDVFVEEMRGRCTNPQIVQYIKDYIQAGYKTGFINDKNLTHVINKFMNVERFADLPPQNRGIYGATFNNNNSPRLTVCINPELDDYNRELFAFHEFNHVIMDGNVERVGNSIGSMRPDIIAQVQDGYTVVEEAIAQNAAEEMMCSLHNRQRPLSTPQQDPTIPNIKFNSNFGYYGLYQPIVSKFARTMRGIGSLRQQDGENVYLNALSARAFNPNFMENIINEYQRDGHFKDLMNSFNQLGIVYRVKQKSIGVQNNTPYNSNDAERAYMNVHSLYSSLEDRRPQRDVSNQEF